jgi:hypothetical protein
MSKENGVKYDNGKPMIGLLPPEAIIEVAKVFTFGAKKYNSHNWRGGLSYSRLYDAALRHQFAWIGGEDLDQESGISHLAHAACGIMMLIAMEQNRKDLDDRYKPKTKLCPVITFNNSVKELEKTISDLEQLNFDLDPK